MNNYITKKSFTQAFFSKYSGFSVLAVNSLLKLNSKYDKIFPSQANIALWIGCSRKTVNVILKQLHDDKWIEKIYRHRQPCIYKISTKFNIIADFPEARKKLPGLINYYYKLILSYFNGPGKQLLEPNVTPYKEENRFIINSSVSVSRIGSLLKGIQNRFINKLLKKEEEAMEHDSTFTVSPILREITNAINLTKWGQIRLTIYSEFALEETFQKYKQGISVKDVYLWFETYCHGVSIKNNLPIHLELYDTMKKRYNMPTNAKWVRTQISYQKDDTFSSENATIISSNSTNSIVGKYKEPNAMFAEFIPVDLRK